MVKLILQNPQRRVQALPKVRYVAVLRDQQRMRLGQRASSHTVDIPACLMVFSVSEKVKP